MRVLLISKWVAGATKGDFYYPGVWRDTFELAKALAKKGINIAILTPKIYSNHVVRFNNEFGSELKKVGIKHYLANINVAFGKDWGAFRLRFFLSELKVVKDFKPDVVQYMQFGPSLLYPFVVRKPIIFYSCYLDGTYLSQKEDLIAKDKDWGVKSNLISYFVFNFQNLLYIILSKIFGSMTLKQAISRGSILVFMHQKGYKRAKQEFPLNKSIYYIQKGINYSEIFKKINIIKQRKSKFLKVLFMGSILYGKGIFDLLESFKEVQRQISQIELVVVGSGPNSLVVKLKKLINKLDLRAKYYGSMNYRNKWKFYLESDIFCLPSYSDSYPSVIFEAAVCGLPVITTFNIDSLVKNGKNGILVNSGDTQALTNAIIGLANLKLRQTMAENIKKEVYKYNWENSADKFVSLYRRLYPPYSDLQPEWAKKLIRRVYTLLSCFCKPA